MKPDVAAPGNKIVSLEANGAYIPSAYSYLHRAGNGTNSYMQLSGTSMAAPMVSGGVALLLQGTPSMTPAQVKMALQAGATYMPDGGPDGRRRRQRELHGVAQGGNQPRSAAGVDGLIGGLLGAAERRDVLGRRHAGARGCMPAPAFASSRFCRRRWPG